MSDVFESYLQARDDSHQAGRPADDWMLSVLAPEERLLKFDSWVRRQLAARLQWPTDARRRAKLIEQCRVKLEHLVLDLWRRGWMLDGQRLARHLLTALDDIAAAQAAGRVKDFWPFFCRVIDGYVGLNSEEIQAEARAVAGARPMHSIIDALHLPKPAPQGPTLPELVAQRRDETLRDRLTARRKADAAREAEKAQLPLF